MIGMIKKCEIEVGYQSLCDMRIIGMHDTNRKKSDWNLREKYVSDSGSGDRDGCKMRNLILVDG